MAKEKLGKAVAKAGIGAVGKATPKLGIGSRRAVGKATLKLGRVGSRRAKARREERGAKMAATSISKARARAQMFLEKWGPVPERRLKLPRWRLKLSRPHSQRPMWCHLRSHLRLRQHRRWLALPGLPHH